MTTTPVDVDVTLPAGWLPIGPVPGALLAAAAVDVAGRSVATMVIRMVHCDGLTDPEDAHCISSAMPAEPDDHVVREVRWCAKGTVAVLAACSSPGREVARADLAAALSQTAVYAVDSTGNAISASSAGEASSGCRGSTRTV